MIPLGVCLMQLARKFPSAGGYFTYVSRTLGPRDGIPDRLGVRSLLADRRRAARSRCWARSFRTRSQANYGIDLVPLVDALVIIGIPLVAWAGYTGMSFSIKWIVVVGAAEFLIVLAPRAFRSGEPGARAASPSRPFTTGFNPGGIATFSGVFLAVVLTVQGLTGWEAAVPLAEETENPRRNVPRSIMASILIIGVMLVIAQWGQVIGWGTDDLPKLPALGGAARRW